MSTTITAQSMAAGTYAAVYMSTAGWTTSVQACMSSKALTLCKNFINIAQFVLHGRGCGLGSKQCCGPSAALSNTGVHKYKHIQTMNERKHRIHGLQHYVLGRVQTLTCRSRQFPQDIRVRSITVRQLVFSFVFETNFHEP